jgi:hypothetical protein
MNIDNLMNAAPILVFILVFVAVCVIAGKAALHEQQTHNDENKEEE